MRNLVKYVGIGLLVMGLAACDDKDTNATAQGSVAESNATGNPVNLLDGKLSFSLPADMTDQSGKLGTQANNMHVWSDATGQKAVIVIMGDDPKEDLAVLAKRLEDQQRSRDPQLQVVTNKAIELKGHKMQQLDSIISAKGQTAYSSVILGNVGNQLLTMQITLPADDQQKAQTTAENIIQQAIHCVLVDECQFLTRQQVYELSEVVDQLDIPVLCYGLRTDFRGELFIGSQYLLAWSDKLVELKTICFCGRKASMVLRLDQAGRPYNEGEQVVIGGNERYVSVCRKHYKEALQVDSLTAIQERHRHD